MTRHFPRIDRDDYPTVGIQFLKRELGRTQYGPTRLVRYVQLLVDECGFPPPLPDMVGERLVSRVTKDSIWRRDPVEIWIADFLPPANAAALDARQLAAAADDMDAAATTLRLVGGRA